MSTFGQLLWREFFYTAATKNPNFDRMLGNPICVQIPWDDNADALAKWASGNTGTIMKKYFVLFLKMGAKPNAVNTCHRFTSFLKDFHGLMRS